MSRAVAVGTHRLHASEDHRECAKSDKRDGDGSLSPRLCAGLVPEERRVDEAEWDAGRAADNGDRDLERTGACPADESAPYDGRAAEQVLLPLDAVRVLAALLAEDSLLHDAHRGEEL